MCSSDLEKNLGGTQGRRVRILLDRSALFPRGGGGDGKIPSDFKSGYDQRARAALPLYGRRRKNNGANDEIFKICANFCVNFIKKNCEKSANRL